MIYFKPPDLRLNTVSVDVIGKTLILIETVLCL